MARTEMLMDKTYPISAETKTLLERLLLERNAASDRLEVAVLATKAALGVPLDYELRDLAVGFERGAGGAPTMEERERVTANGNHN